MASTDSRLTNARTPTRTRRRMRRPVPTRSRRRASARTQPARRRQRSRRRRRRAFRLSAAGADNGVATLDASGKVPTTQLPAAILGALDYQGTYDCSGGSYPGVAGEGAILGLLGRGDDRRRGVWRRRLADLQRRVLEPDRQPADRLERLRQGRRGDALGERRGRGRLRRGGGGAAAAEAASIPGVRAGDFGGTPGSDSNVPSEKAVRTALASAITTAESASDAAGAAAAAAAASVPNSALVTSVGSPGSDSNVPSEKAVRTALAAAISTAEAACDAAGAAAAAQSAAEAASDPAGSAATVAGQPEHALRADDDGARRDRRVQRFEADERADADRARGHAPDRRRRRAGAAGRDRGGD